MLRHLDTNDPRYPQLAGEILRRHDANEAEANIRSAVRDLLIATNLAKSDEIVEETSPALGSRKAVDLTALDTFIEFKRRVGTTGGGPDPKNVRQIDDYLALSADEGRVRMGVLTDGKRWLLRWPGAREPRLSKPYWFTLENEDGWLPLYEWLRDDALVALENVTPDEEAISTPFWPALSLLRTRDRCPEIPVRPEFTQGNREGQTSTVARPVAVSLGRDHPGARGFGRPVRTAHISQRGHRHGGAGVVRSGYPQDRR